MTVLLAMVTITIRRRCSTLSSFFGGGPFFVVVVIASNSSSLSSNWLSRSNNTKIHRSSCNCVFTLWSFFVQCIYGLLYSCSSVQKWSRDKNRSWSLFSSLVIKSVFIQYEILRILFGEYLDCFGYLGYLG